MGKPEECCEKRLDDCSVPIYDTLCYCDEFCITDIDQPKNDDCCPDFREVCLGEKPSKDDPGPKCAEGQLLCEEDECMVEEKEIRTVNQRPLHYGWRASNYSNFWGRKAKDGLMLRTGSFIPEELSMKMNPIALRPDVSQIPSRFDARTKREWLGRVSDVRDQGWCGASWAFSTIGVTQDRLKFITSTAMMEVHKDLFMYKSGIYSYSGVTKGETASHSVRIIGWGEDPLPGSRPVKYWLVANSWGKDWGENGLFKIRRGTNESGIETFVLAVRVRLANYVYGV
ncbi:Papain family cysteine protease-containing protein [Homarus americanus]|uniref:Papain family cysteine protease-containing protein n=1 Tax=Homarus americanus TaxID=6706 RepID=A0A8J5TUZ6_HOMAM|nr:Papain family cysteine protease-containing protein [Homarus americanus]